MDRPLRADVVAFGEIGLAGEVRAVPGIERRLLEAHRLGFTRAIVPVTDVVAPVGMQLSQVGDIHEALAVALTVVSEG